MTAIAKTPPPRVPPVALAAPFPDYDGWDEAQLKSELAKRLGLTAENLIHAAAIWAALERKGVDLSGIKDGFTLYLPHIAAGTVLAELVVAFAGRPYLLRKLARLTPAEQRSMVDGNPIAVVNAQGQTQMFPVRMLNTRQIAQVFGDGTIRTEREQHASRADALPKIKPGRLIKRGKVTVDRARGIISIGRASAALVDAIEALRKAGVTL